MNSKKVHPIITIDPVSGKKLYATRLENFDSGVVIEGTFELSKFNYLTTEQRYFIEIFIKNRGSIKQVEKELDISYPTVKKMLDDVILGLGYSLDEEGNKDEDNSSSTNSNLRDDILNKVSLGLLDIKEALKLLNNKGDNY